jgi:hypothetical protein
MLTLGSSIGMEGMKRESLKTRKREHLVPTVPASSLSCHLIFAGEARLVVQQSEMQGTCEIWRGWADWVLGR